MRNEVELNGASARALAVDRHFLGVAAEATDVRLHPLKRLHLVEESCVEVPVSGVPQGGSSEKSERGEPVVHRDDDHVGALVDPVVEGPVRRISVDIAWKRR